jgi:branched-subunit amino acid ABC-type transport system permease component
MDFWAVLLIEIAYGVASLTLISIGLAVIFGMMRVINFAHGEFLMMGGYSVILLTQAGANLWVAMLLIAPAVVGAIGVLIELLLIRWLYGRMIETLLATWGLSFFLIGLATTLFGNTTRGLSAPLGSLVIGQYKTGMYEVFVIGVAIAVSIVTFAVLRYTRTGLIARATMQNATMASALGVATPMVYTVTFGVGAALSGLAGAVLAPLSGVLPTMGLAYVAKAFIVVITGGVGVISGTATSSALLGVINQLATYATQPVVGEVALLAAAIILLRLMPQGITGRFFRKGL